MRFKLVVSVVLVMLFLFIGCQSSDSEMPGDVIKSDTSESEANHNNIFDPFSVQEGEEVGDMKVVSISASSLENNLNTVSANFIGVVTASGVIYNVTDEFLGEAVYFIPDDESKALFPKADIDERYIWFVFNDYETSKALFEENFGDVVSSAAIVEIDNYTINYAPSDVFNQATLIDIKK